MHRAIIGTERHIVYIRKGPLKLPKVFIGKEECVGRRRRSRSLSGGRIQNFIEFIGFTCLQTRYICKFGISLHASVLAKNKIVVGKSNRWIMLEVSI